MGDDFTAMNAAQRSQIDDVIGLPDQLKIMLYHNNRVSLINQTLKQLQKIATPEALLEYMKYEPHEKGDVLVLTGIGKIYPFMRSHKMLDSMQHLFEDIPIVMFYPGSFNGQDLGLFGRFLDGHYYRAFNLL